MKRKLLQNISQIFWVGPLWQLNDNLKTKIFANLKTNFWIGRDCYDSGKAGDDDKNIGEMTAMMMLSNLEGRMHVGRHDGSDSDDKVACRSFSGSEPENSFLQIGTRWYNADDDEEEDEERDKKAEQDTM